MYKEAMYFYVWFNYITLNSFHYGSSVGLPYVTNPRNYTNVLLPSRLCGVTEKCRNFLIYKKNTGCP